MRYQREKLEAIIRNGSLLDKGMASERYAFKGLNNMSFEYSLNSGLIRRTEADGTSKLFGLPKYSRHKTGYLTCEMVIPYDPVVHQDIKDEQLIYDKYGHLIGVQYTCYIHQIASVVNDVLLVEPRKKGTIANHKDGCPLHNWASNIETVTNTLNNWHGAVLQSVLHRNPESYSIKTDSNAVRSWRYMNEISAYDIAEYMRRSSKFEKEVKDCAESLADKSQSDKKYISETMLRGLYNFLILIDKV